MIKKVLGLIIARDGSVGLKNKNIKKLKGKHLVEWSFITSKKSKIINKLIFSTDSLKMIKLAKKHGIDTPFIRPKKLSTSNANVKDVIFHTVKWLKKKRKEKFSHLILLQATSPFRNESHIDSSLKYYFSLFKKDETLISVKKISNKFNWMLKKKSNQFVKLAFNKSKLAHNRQQLEDLYLPNGAIYICNLENFKGNFYSNKTIPFLMDEKSSVDIDNLDDFNLAKSYK